MPNRKPKPPPRKERKVNLIDLKPFCDPTRPHLAEPFNRGEHTYATNGRILVRVAKLPEAVEVPAAPGLQQLDSLIPDLTELGEYIELPAIPPEESEPCSDCASRGYLLKDIQCPACDGVGWLTCVVCQSDSHRCKRCNGDRCVPGPDEPINRESCKQCRGEGRHIKQNNLLVGTQRFDCRYLRLLATLPKVRLANSTKLDSYIKGGQPVGAAKFTFDGGEGLLMPMRV